MKKYNFKILIWVCIVFPSILSAQKTVEWPPEMTESYSPIPQKINSGMNIGDAPSDAVILFDGSNFDHWRSTTGGGNAEWVIEGNAMTINPGKGNIETKESFGDIQLHLEFRIPKENDMDGQGKGNSGVFIQKKYEVQILDSYEYKTYVNGQAGSIYKQNPPLVNPTKKPGDWQTYDIVFMRPRFVDGHLVKPGTITVFLNGVLIQNHFQLRGTTEYKGLPKNIAHGKEPIMLQDHGNKVSFRNIWIRELE